ncbi:hypothetical protein Tco_1404558 [Tanacetum coccineum]
MERDCQHGLYKAGMGSSRVLSDFAEKYGSKNRVLAGFGIGGKSGKEKVSDQAKEIKLLKAKITKLKRKANPVIKHFKAYQKRISKEQRHQRKHLSKKKKVQIKSVSKQGRKNAKGDGKAKENAQSEGRTKEMMDEDKETNEVKRLDLVLKMKLVLLRKE